MLEEEEDGLCLDRGVNKGEHMHHPYVILVLCTIGDIRPSSESFYLNSKMGCPSFNLLV